MANVIAVIWDFDKTLIKGYMEDPILEDRGIDPKVFWAEVNALPNKYWKEQRVKVNPETIYLNHMLKYVREGKLQGLSNAKLREYGGKMEFYSGVPDIFKATQELVNNDRCKEYNVSIEHYIVSSGLAAVIRGTILNNYVTNVWGCEFIEADNGKGEREISEIGYTIDNTTKTRALFEINKGVGKIGGMEVNTTIPEEHRRVHFINMVYVADGPSDIPAFSVVKRNGGATFAIYPQGDRKALQQVEQMRQDGRIDMFAEADYSKDKTASMWLCMKIEEFAKRIIEEEKAKISKYTNIKPPAHLT